MERVHDRTNADLPINSVVAEALVPDPLEPGAQLRVLRSVRDDPLAALHARRQIDDAMLAAGRRWQKYFDEAEIGNVRAIDPGKEAVDGGKFPEMLTDTQIKAFRALERADIELGRVGKVLIRDILGDNLSVKQASFRRGRLTEAHIKFTGLQFRECLNVLAVLWGYAQRA